MSSETADETKFCSNCKKDIAAANFTMHEVHCRRHLVLCEHCQEPVPRTEMDQHFTDVHAKVACSQCAMEMEKDQLDDHLEKDCPKRQVSCEYCELQLPYSDLGAHVEFCGTRTEACPRCGNFVMQKDLPRHNSSNCAYPEPKPPAVHPRGSQDRGGGDERLFAEQRAAFFGHEKPDDSFDMFEFEEIRRALEGDGEGRSLRSLLVEDSDAAAASGEMGGWRRGRGLIEPRWNPAFPARKKNDVGRARKNTNSRISGASRQKEQAIPPDADYDSVLARQLAEADDGELAEFDPDAHLNELMSNFEKRSQPVRRHSPMEEDVTVPATPPSNYDDFSGADEDMIPCEFCGETFPAYALVHHQSVCDPLASGLWGEGLDISPAFGQNNNILQSNHWRSSVSRPPAIPVINNLGSASPAEESVEEPNHHLADNGDHFLDSLENTMLPCEFCSELLPADSLVQHQAMCEGKPATPQVRTPAAAQPSSSSSGGQNRNVFFPTPASRSRHRHADPTEELLAIMSQRDQENRVSSQRSQKKMNTDKAGHPWSRSDIYPGNRHGAARYQQRTGFPNSLEHDEEQDVNLHGRRGGSRPGQGRADGASRTRHTLNALLTDEGVDDDDRAAGRMGQGNGPNRRSQGPHKRTPNAGAPSPNTGVSARTVMRSMGPQNRRQRPQPRGDSSAEGEAGAGGRRGSQRERGISVFNNLDNSHNPPSQNRSRRTDRQPME